jgi:hypothetical protein
MSDVNAAASALCNDQRVIFSILIGRVSTHDSSRIFETLDALRVQSGSPPYEVIIADRRLDAVTEVIRSQYPEVRVLPCAVGTSLPELRTLAFESSRGEFVVITEDHCIPPKNWLASILEAFNEAPEEIAAVGGAIENGLCDTVLDWATFLFEYSAFVPPIPSGPTVALPGMNVAYRRSRIGELDRAILLRGFWETTVHPLLSQKGFILYLSNEIRILHKKKFSFRLFAYQRFLYSRYYSGLRSSQAHAAARWAMCAMSLTLPPLLLVRTLGNLMTKKQFLRQFTWALPYMTIFALIGTCGEFVGCVCGPGNALARIE